MTFESTPPSYSSVNDHLVYVAYDSNAADPVTYPNYKYVYEVWVNGTLEFTGKVFPHPTSSRGIINVGNVVREYIAALLSPSAGILAQEMGEGIFSVSIVVKIREEYSGTVGAVVLTDSTRVYFNHYNGRYSDFTILGSYTAKPLSNRPVKINLTYGCSYFFIPYFSQTTSSFNVVITGGTSTRTKTITPTAANTLQLLNICPAAINIDYAGNFTSATETYTVAVGGVTYEISVVCSGMYTNYLVHFLNKFGGFETMLFNKARKKTFEVDKKEWQQLPYRVSSAGVVSVKSGVIMHPQKSNYASLFKEKLRINTELLSDAEYQWLSELVVSPYILLEDSGTMYPVVLSSTNYDFKERIFDGAQNLAVDIEFGSQTKAQFR
jgi:hypothetical protein